MHYYVLYSVQRKTPYELGLGSNHKWCAITSRSAKQKICKNQYKKIVISRMSSKTNDNYTVNKTIKRACVRPDSRASSR